MKKQTVHLVGMGISSITAAVRLEQLRPNEFNFKFYESRSELGGNCADVKEENGFIWQKYGPHIFHTSNLKVWNFIRQFSEWFDYRHRVQTLIDSTLVPLPISKATYSALRLSTTILNLQARRDQYKDNRSFLVAKFGITVAEDIITSYSERQWKLDINSIPYEVIERLGVRLDNCPYYFNDSIQKQPLNGFSDMFNTMLSTLPNRTIEYDCAIDSSDVSSIIEDGQANGIVIWTGHLDSLHDRGEVLPWRNTNIKNIHCRTDGFFQTSGTVNHSKNSDGIRTSDYAHISNNAFFDSTVICIEDPIGELETETSVKAYPVHSTEVKALRSRMLEDISKRYKGRVIPLGRLGQYLYLDMHQAIASAMVTAEKLAKFE